MLNSIAREISEKYYFSYIPEETNYLKGKGFFYITKAIHPRNNLIFCLFEKSDKLINATREFRNKN